MSESATATEAALTEVRSSLDLLHGRVACMDTTQQQLVAQLALIATAVQEGAKRNEDAARRFAELKHRMEDAITRRPPQSPQEDDPDPDACITTGTGTTQTARVTWTGTTPGAGASTAAASGGGGGGELGGAGGRTGGAGAGFLGGVGGGDFGGAGGCRTGGAGAGFLGGVGGGRTTGDSAPRTNQIKMSFPRFDGEQPRIWKDKCLDYFRLFNVHPALWLVSCTLHMDGNAALWLRAYRLRHEVNSWPELMAAVEEKFGADDHRRYMKQLLALKQRGTVEEYQAQFEQLSYHIAMQNPNYDEQFFVSQFIKGLKSDIRGMVEAQVPDTLERAILLALVQQEVLAEAKPWAQRQQYPPRQEQQAQRAEPPRPAVRLGTGDFWKDRQLRDYRRANGECFKCGEKYDPTHQCAKKHVAELHALTTDPTPEQLSEEVLNMMELHDIAEAQQLSLSLNAMAGTDGGDTIRLRALVGNQVLLILIDSGSTGSFLNESMLARLNCSVQTTTPVTVRLANNQELQCDKLVPNLSWWIQGETFHTSMRVMPLGGYDAILGVDWLKCHGPINGDWITKTITVTNMGKRVLLQGVQSNDKPAVRELPVEQLLKWNRGNDIWALAVLHPDTEATASCTPAAVQEVLDRFTTVFEEPSTLPPSRPYDHAIALKPDATPFNARPYRYSPEHKTEIERQVRSMLDAGIICPSMSPFASPVLLVLKKDGSWRFCIDYRRLNELTVKNVFPMPVIDELLDELAGAKIFSKLDLRAGYHQIRMHPADEAKTAFKTHQGHYQFKVMPFGLCNAPATFQCVMNVVLAPCLRKSVLVFMDDILVYSTSLEQHVEHLTEVLQLLQTSQLFVKRSKCTFACDSLEYLGHIISAHGVATDPQKTQAMVNWPIPTTITELRGFLGLTGYYRKFVRNYAVIAKPLTNLLKKKSFLWSDTATTAFEALKHAMTTTPVLSLPDFNKQFVVETDACDSGIGAVLMQEQHPIAFLSKPLSKQHLSLSIYDKEFLALLMAVERWRSYLQRAEFIIRTDHHSLCYLDDQTLQSPLQKKAMARLMGLQFKISYKKGSENAAADALSRVGHVMAIQVCSEVQPAWLQEVLNSYVTDTEAHRRLTELAVVSPDEHGYALINGVIRRHGRVWIGSNSALQTKLITAFHASAVGGHSGAHATYQRLKKLFVWNGIKAHVTEFVRQCEVCQHAKHSNTPPAGLLQPLPPPTGPWRDITMDFVEGLPLSDGANVIMVVVDRFTKFAHFVPLKHPYTAPSVARVFIDSVVKLHGMPRTIISDRDCIFTSAFWKKLFQQLGTKLKFTTAYHPQTDGQSERVNQCLEMFLRCSIQDAPRQWRRLLPMAEFWYNSCFHTSLGCSPFQALYGHEPNFGALPELDPDTKTPTDDFLAERAAQVAILKANLEAAQARMKVNADKHRVEREFQVGEPVLLRLQPHAQSSVVNRPCHKLAYKFFGPYPVLERIGKVAYRLELPPNSSVHNVFHVSQLKEFRPDYTPVFRELPIMPQLDITDTEPELILDRKLVKKGKVPVPQVLIKWKKHPVEAATWEDWEVLKKSFPGVLALGQASASPGGSVTDGDSAP